MLTFEFLAEKDIDRVMLLDNQYEHERYSQENFREFFSNKFVDIIVVVENNVDVGYAIIMTIFEESNLIKIVVTNECRNSGIGTKLLDFIKNHLKNKNSQT